MQGVGQGVGLWSCSMWMDTCTAIVKCACACSITPNCALLLLLPPITRLHPPRCRLPAAEAAELSLAALIAGGQLDPVQWAGRQAADGRALRVGQLTGPLSSAAALLWRVVCEALFGDAVSKGLAAAATSGANAAMEAAAAAERHEVRAVQLGTMSVKPLSIPPSPCCGYERTVCNSDASGSKLVLCHHRALSDIRKCCTAPCRRTLTSTYSTSTPPCPFP